MTETPVGKPSVSPGIPTVISMLITNIYNMADSYFVSQPALRAGATSIVFGVMAILQAFGFMFGHGSGSYIGRLLGIKHNETSNAKLNATQPEKQAKIITKTAKKRSECGESNDFR